MLSLLLAKCLSFTHDPCTDEGDSQSSLPPGQCRGERAAALVLLAMLRHKQAGFQGCDGSLLLGLSVLRRKGEARGLSIWTYSQGPRLWWDGPTCSGNAVPRLLSYTLPPTMILVQERGVASYTTYLEVAPCPPRYLHVIVQISVLLGLPLGWASGRPAWGSRES